MLPRWQLTMTSDEFRSLCSNVKEDHGVILPCCKDFAILDGFPNLGAFYFDR